MEIAPWKRMTDFIPPPSKYERDSLTESIKNYGIKTAVLALPDGRIIDGATRYSIANELNIECPTLVLDLDEDTAFQLGVSLNLDRRQLSFEQIREMRDGQKKAALTLREQGKTQEETAAAVGVTQPALSQWEAEERNDISTNNVSKPADESKGPPDCRLKLKKSLYPLIIKRYSNGETASEIAADYKVTPHRIEQIIKKIMSEKKKVATRIKALKVEAQIKKQDAMKFLKGTKEKSVDLLITDPPYSTDIDDIEGFVEEWIPLALNTLKDTGQAYICIGAYAWEMLAYLFTLRKFKKRFGEPQILVWTYKNTIGPKSKTQYQRNWQAILYLRGPKAPDLNDESLMNLMCVQEINAPDGRVGDRYHAWEKPMKLATRLISQSTDGDSLIIDPFAGTGTFLLAAAGLGRKNSGSDNDNKMIKIAMERGCILVD
jgi:DNA modification methylase